MGDIKVDIWCQSRGEGERSGHMWALGGSEGRGQRLCAVCMYRAVCVYKVRSRGSVPCCCCAMRLNEIEIGTALGHSNLGTMSPANEPAVVRDARVEQQPAPLPFHYAAPTHACHASLLQHPSGIQTSRWIANAVSAPLATPSRALLSPSPVLCALCRTGKLLPCHTILNGTVHDATRSNSQSRTTERRNRAWLE
jgi:hypothetical protein